MTNDPRDESIGQGGERLEFPGGAEEKTVFAPSSWERRREEKAAAKAAATPEEAAARREEAKARKEEAAADLEARRLELKIAQENRKAQEEERRRQRKAEEEQRRQQRRAQEAERREEVRQRKEEDRQRRREEKAQEATVRRVGTLTLGVSLIAIGAAILAYMVKPGFDIRVVAYLAPVILIGLGAEILVRQLIGKGKPFRYDFASGFLCVLLVIGSFGVALVPYVVYYVSPQRFSTQERQLDGVRDQLYAAFRGEQRVRNYSVDGNVGNILSAAHVDENGQWTYQLDYLIVDVTLMDSCDDEAAFARTCRQLMDKMMTHGFHSGEDSVGRGDHFTLHFGCPENEEGVSYNLWADSRLKLEMEASTLEKLVTASYSRPTRANGWTNDGYEEIADNFGTEYADHFAELMERFGPDEAQRYYTILVDTYLVDIAEMYYNGCINGPIMPVPEEAGPTERENGTAPITEGTEDPGAEGGAAAPVTDGTEDETEGSPVPGPAEMPVVTA